MDPLVSIIVPVHNTPQQYLEKSIECLLAQTYRQIEIVLVDDASQDQSARICDRYEAGNDTVKTIHLTGIGGVSRARNAGIQASLGEYIIFLDSDDWMEVNAVERAVHLAKEHNAQLVSWNHYYNYEKDFDKDIPQKPMPHEILIYEKQAIETHLVYDMVAPEYDSRLHNTDLGEIRVVWGKIFEARIIKDNGIHFEEKLKLGEDACFNLDVLRHTDKAVCANSYLNHYRMCSDSANHRVRDDIVEIRLELLKNYRRRFEENDSIFSLCYTREVLSCIVNCLTKYFCVNCAEMKKKRRELRALLSNEYVECVSHMECNTDFLTIIEQILLKMVKRKNTAGLMLAGKAMRVVKRMDS